MVVVASEVQNSSTPFSFEYHKTVQCHMQTAMEKLFCGITNTGSVWNIVYFFQLTLEPGNT